jgi:hypothetical protein
MTLNKPFNSIILNEIISFFENNIIICGSLSDYIHINYEESLLDYDFIIKKSCFLHYFSQLTLPDNIVYKNFLLRRKKSSFFTNVSYIGTYKDSFIVDFFVKESITDDIIHIDSEKIIQNSSYNKIIIDSAYSRIDQLKRILTIQRKKGMPYWVHGWLKNKHKKASLKLDLYNKLYPEYL